MPAAAQRATESVSAEYFASPTGGGTTCSAKAPCTIQQAILTATPGDTLWLLDGIYAGPRQMIAPGTYAVGKSGTSDRRITIKAVTDGAVWIDGQYTYEPLRLSGNQYWIIEGVNVYNSSNTVVELFPGSHNNIIRRVCAWNANISSLNEHVWLIWDSSFNLLEDICGFGTGRNTLSEYGASSQNTIRRAWLRWEGWPSNSGGEAPGPVLQISYETFANSLLENIVTIHSAERYDYPQPTSGSVFGGWHIRDGAPSGSPGYRVRGAIVYGYPNPKLPLNHAFFNYQSKPIDIKDVYVDGTSQGQIWPVVLGCKVPPCENSVADRVTTIRGASESIIDGSWTITNFRECTSVDACPNLYTGVSAANACYRYQDGVLGSAPLWPWPMDARIRAALSAAGSSALAGTDGTVTSEIESLFGPIPSGCLGQS
jgi:hypothetical protein